MTLFEVDEYVDIADCVVQFIDDYFESSFMWTAHNEIDFKWDYVKTFDEGWFDGLNKPRKFPKAQPPKKDSKTQYLF